ncbi:ATP-binding cassette subfamily C protein [Pseudonocardia hierapolitana]|uniref:ATP-binding cassette subfamily C protein n=1 Tax=Pseudonocardia hierapolitana TaxID=1128676 RepID=A0A561T2D6_9PSEU|nr:ABC transporter ATP-binding protein [Pseudonocardia hierapolitana]TWF81272.1 ATP-binding cassette subfamily C protein [Pseudonocardia hierapolitana]
MTPPRAALAVATPGAARRAALRLVRADARTATAMVLLSALAAAAGLAGPWLVGRAVDAVQSGEVWAGNGPETVDRLALGIVACALVQLVLARQARWAAHRFGERTLSRVRERYVERVLALPTGVVERAGVGARGTGDVAVVAATLRDAGPDLFVAAVQALFLLAAVVVVAPPLGACGLVGLVGTWFAVRWYLRRAHAAYLAEGAAASALAEVLTATAAGARTVEALRLQERRIDACDAAIGTGRRARERTLALRSVLFPAVDICHVLPVAAVLLVGGVLVAHGATTLGAVAAAALYLQQLANPLNTILWRVEQLQSSTAAFARVEGLAGAPPPPAPRLAARPGARPVGERVAVRGVHFGYPGHDRDALRGVDLELRPGERIALVGPSGAGKSTLGRLLAGLDAPRTGTVTVGGVPVAGLDRAERRRHIVLVTQEHHVFLGTVRDNLLLAAPAADDDALRAALDCVGCRVDELPDGLDTRLGPDGHRPGGALAQRLALARVVLADPHTVVLDEATALLDPATARSTERALAAALAGRTVVAIAHRLHTAHDADRVAVLQDGRVTELGAHDELIAAGGAYAALWYSWQGHSWQGSPGTAARRAPG